MMFREVSATPSPAKAMADTCSVNTENAKASSHQSPQMPNIVSSQGNSDSESDEQIRRPVGKAARRMLQGNDDVSSKRSTPAPSSPPLRRDASMSSDEEDLYGATPMKRRPAKTVPVSPPGSQACSTLFVSPAKSQRSESEDDFPTRPSNGESRLVQLVAEKRAERLAREAEERKHRREQGRNSPDLPDEMADHSQDEDDRDIDRIMSDAVKPTRKASRKAMLEMERETQRIARQQALAHEMKVKKKFTTSDLFAKFNFRPSADTNTLPNAEGDTTASSAPNSDGVDAPLKEPVSTPPTSPPTPLDRQRALVEKGALSKMTIVRQDSLASLANLDDSDGEVPPDASAIMDGSRNVRAATVQEQLAEPQTKKGLKLAKFGKKAVIPSCSDDSDDDLEIIRGTLPAHLRIFEKAKGVLKQRHADSKAIHTLKHLSYLGTDSGFAGRRKKGSSRPSVNPQVLEAQLRMRAKEQARAQQQERIAELKAKGIELQTAEEREREQEAFENLLEKARQEAVELRKAEKAAAKGDNPEARATASDDDDSEDGDFVDEEGSDAEHDGDDEQEGYELVDDAADEAESEEDDDDEEELEENVDKDVQMNEGEKPIDHEPIAASPQDLKPSQTPMFTRKLRKSRVIIEDDDDSDSEASKRPKSIVDDDDDAGDGNEDPFAAFNFGAAVPGSSLMSPTQAFNATMQTPSQLTQQDSMEVLRNLVPVSSSVRPPLSWDLEAQTQDDSQMSVIPASQREESQPINLQWETQSPETPVLGQDKRGSRLSETPGWQPTQDDGLPATWGATPTLRRENTLESIPENDTQSTVRLRISESPAPAAARRRLVHRKQAASESSDDENAVLASEATPAHKDVFREMARRRREALSTAELAEAELQAKGMMDEQAEESEDEYAGLGGDDFVAPETEEDREMIDSGHVEVNERQIAAHFAERQRAADEAAASKLYKDLTTGALRRKQANMFDLDEDEDDLAIRRRQMRQREEARKRKLLLQDDKIAGLAEGKQSRGKDAFLKAIADDDERDEDALDLSDAEDPNDSQATQTDSQPSQQVSVSSVPLQEVSGNKRRLEEAPEDRPSAKQRRTKASAFRAPASLLEVRETLSFLLHEPHAEPVGSTALDFSSESENEEQTKEEEEADYLTLDDNDAMEEERERQNDGGFAPERVLMPPPRLPASQRRTTAKPAVVDRLSLKRGSSALEDAQGRTAWGSQGGGYKVPSLLRRATTNMTLTTSNSNSLPREDSGGVKMGGTKKSSLAYQSRVEERKAHIEASVKQRKADNMAHIASLRRAASSGFGKGLSGHFESE